MLQSVKYVLHTQSQAQQSHRRGPLRGVRKRFWIAFAFLASQSNLNNKQQNQNKIVSKPYLNISCFDVMVSFLWQISCYLDLLVDVGISSNYARAVFPT